MIKLSWGRAHAPAEPCDPATALTVSEDTYAWKALAGGQRPGHVRTTYTDTGWKLKPDSLRYYRVFALNAAGERVRSPVVQDQLFASATTDVATEAPRTW